MSEANGTVKDGQLNADGIDRATAVNRIKDKTKAVKGSGMAFYDAMKRRTAKKKGITLKADTDDATTSVTVNSFPTLSKSAIESAAASAGAKVSFKLKGGIDGKDISANGTYEGEHASGIVADFFAIETAEKD